MHKEYIHFVLPNASTNSAAFEITSFVFYGLLGIAAMSFCRSMITRAVLLLSITKSSETKSHYIMRPNWLYSFCTSRNC